jgi:hypothetical protein
VLAEREPVPRRVGRDAAAAGVLAEVADEMAFARGHVSSEPCEGRGQIGVGIAAAAEREVRPEEPELLLPRLGEEPLGCVVPAGRARDTPIPPPGAWGVAPHPLRRA